MTYHPGIATVLLIGKNLLCNFSIIIAHDANTTQRNIHTRKSRVSALVTRAWDKNTVSETIV